MMLAMCTRVSRGLASLTPVTDPTVSRLQVTRRWSRHSLATGAAYYRVAAMKDQLYISRLPSVR